jgi:hypothetical protein
MKRGNGSYLTGAYFRRGLFRLTAAAWVTQREEAARLTRSWFIAGVPGATHCGPKQTSLKGRRPPFLIQINAFYSVSLQSSRSSNVKSANDGFTHT